MLQDTRTSGVRYVNPINVDYLPQTWRVHCET